MHLYHRLYASRFRIAYTTDFTAFRVLREFSEYVRRAQKTISDGKSFSIPWSSFLSKSSVFTEQIGYNCNNYVTMNKLLRRVTIKTTETDVCIAWYGSNEKWLAPAIAPWILYISSSNMCLEEQKEHVENTQSSLSLRVFVRVSVCLTMQKQVGDICRDVLP